jgi:hypothetical protein
MVLIGFAPLTHAYLDEMPKAVLCRVRKSGYILLANNFESTMVRNVFVWACPVAGFTEKSDGVKCGVEGGGGWPVRGLQK